MKFLRGKVWQIALAVCLLVVLLCITASAEGDPMVTELWLGDEQYTLTQGETLYFTTTGGNVVKSDTAIEDTYNIKLVFEEGNDAIPTMYVRDAYIGERNSGWCAVQSVSNGATKFLIVVERVENPTTKNGIADQDFVWANMLKWTHGDLEIRGYKGDQAPTDPDQLGRVYNHSAFQCLLANGKTLTFNNVNASITSKGTDTREAVNAKYVVFNGCGTIRLQSKVDGAINGASTVTVNGGDVTLVSETQRAINGDYSSSYGLLIKGGTLTVQAGGYLTEGLGQYSASGYKNAAGEALYYSVVGTEFDGTDATESNPGAFNITDKHYFRIEPAYRVAVTDGAADKAKYTVGETVKLTPADKGASVFDKWVVANDSAKIEINEDNGVYTFLMPEGNVKVTADYIETATISLAGTNYTFTEGEVLYFTTTSDGAVTKLEDVQEGTVPDHQIRLEFVNEIPTMELNGATIKHETNTIVIGDDVSLFVIDTKSKSSIVQTTKARTFTYSAIGTAGKLKFTGTGQLDIEGYANVIGGRSQKAEIEFDHANVNLKALDGTWGTAVFHKYNNKLFTEDTSRKNTETFKSIVFNGGKVVANTPYMVMYSGNTAISIVDNAHVELISTGSTITYAGVTFDIDNGYLYAKGKANPSKNATTGAISRGYIFQSTSKITVGKNGALEAVNTGTTIIKDDAQTEYIPEIFANAPELEGTNYYAVLGASKTAAAQYASGTLNNSYFAAGRSVNVTVDNGTAQAFAESGTSITAIKGVDVTLVANDVPAGEVFAKWTAPSGTIANANAATTTFKPTEDVTVTANFGKQASVTIAGTARSVVQGSDALYFTTTGGTVALGGDESTYNIKFVYPAGDGATPKLYLRGAYLTQAIASNANTVAGTAIIVEKVGNYPSTVPDSAVEEGEAKPDSYITVGISWTNMALTIQGYEGNNENPALADMGKLKMTLTAGRIANVGSAYQLTFKDLDLTATTTAVSLPSSVTFDGGKASITSNTAVYQIWPGTTDTTSTGVRVTGGADVSLVGVGNTICIYNSTSSKVIIEKDSKLKVVSSNASQPLRADDTYNGGVNDVLQVKGGTLEAISNGSSVGFGMTYARMSGYDDTFFAINGTSVMSSAEIQLNSYSYFKVEPAYTISVSNGTASVKTDRVTVDNATKAPVGATVTLTPAAKSGHRFYEWTYGQNSQKPPIANNAFTMPKGAVSVEANYDEIKIIKILNVAREFTAHEPLYFTTTAGAVDPLTDGDLENLYNVKLAVDDEGVPTVYLKGAVINASSVVLSNGTGVTSFAIVAEGSDSVLSSSGNCIYVDRADLTIKGPKKLTINSNSAGKEYGPGAGIQLYHYDSKTEEAATHSITFASDANVCINTATTAYSGCIWNEPNTVSPDVHFLNGTQVELISGSNISYTSFTPKIAEDYTDWAAVITADQAASPTAYTKGTALYGHDYFKIAPGKVVTLTNATSSVLSNGGRAFAGQSVTVTPTLSSGQGVAYWTSSLSQDKSYDSTFAFTMGSDAVTVSATIGAASGVKLGSTAYQVVQNGKTYYFTTNANGEIVAGGDESTYNIKLIYPTGATTPMIYLRGAYVNQAIASSSSAPTTTIVVEKVGSYPSAVPEGVDADSYITHAISWGNYNLTIQGYTGAQENPALADMGVLKMATSGMCISMGHTYQLTFKDLNLDVTTQTESLPDSVAFDGGKAVVLAEADVVYSSWGWPDPAVLGNGISVTGNADVLLKTTHSGVNAVSIYQSTAANIVIDSGKLQMQSTTSQAIRFERSGAFRINGGTVILQGASDVCAAYGSSLIPDLSGYKNSEDDAHYYATLGGKAYTAGTAIKSDSNSYNSVFKVVPAYEVSVTNGTADKQIVGVGSATITLSPDAAEVAAGKNVAYWTSEQLGSVEFYDSTISFTMPEKSITFTGTYGAAADLKIDSTTYTAVRGGKIHYYTTTETGAIAAGDSSNYNIMYEYTDDTTATITLRDAYITGTIANGTNVAEKTKVIVVKTDETTNVGGTATAVDAYLGRSFTWNNNDLEISGEGKLKSVSNFSVTNALLTFKDLDLEMVGGTLLTGDPEKIIFNGCNATLNSSYLAINVDNSPSEGLLVTNGATVDITSANIALYYAGSANAQVVVESGSLTVETTTEGATMQFGGDIGQKIIIKGGVVEFSNSTESKKIGGYIPDLSQYNPGNAGDTYWAATATNATGTGMGEYGANRLDNYKYFRVEPGYSINVNGGKANWTSYPANKSITIDLTATNLPQGQDVQYWSSPAWGDAKTVKYHTFTMPSEPITINASLGNKVIMYLNSGDAVVAVEGGLPRYYNITDSATTAVQSTQTYNVVFSYEEDGTPVLRLKDVQLSAGRIHNFDNALITDDVGAEHLTKAQVELLDLIVELEGTNSLKGGAGLGPVSFVGNSLTFRSVNGGTLALQTIYRCVKMVRPADAEENATLIYDDANVTLNTTGGWQPGMELYNADVVVDGGSLTVSMTNTNCSIFRVVQGSSVVKIKGNAVVDFSAELENCIIGIATIDLSEYVDNEGNPLYAAIAAVSRDAFMEDPEGSIYNSGDSLSGKKFFRVEPKMVKVQITWGAMSFTYNGSIWNVDTHSWEGNWEPDAGESEGLVSNQIHVENVGTEAVMVTFDFAAADAFATAYAEIHGIFVDENNNAINAAYQLNRFAETDAFLKLNSVAVASDFGTGAVLGTITVRVDALTPAQGGNA